MIPFHCVSTAIQQIQRNLHSMHTFLFHLFSCCSAVTAASTAASESATAGGFLGVEQIILHAVVFFVLLLLLLCSLLFAYSHSRLQLDCNWIILLTRKRCAFYLFQATAALQQFLTPTHTLIQI